MMMRGCCGGRDDDGGHDGCVRLRVIRGTKRRPSSWMISGQGSSSDYRTPQVCAGPDLHAAQSSAF
eukprot:1236690-Rhodomonas_salina.1